MKPSAYCALLVLLFLIAACKSTQIGGTYPSDGGKPKLLDNSRFLITAYATDKTYGYSEKNPIMVGGAESSEGPLNERRFLNALAGPNGEPITYIRRGSCCAFKTPRGLIDNAGLLDIYEVRWDGLKEPVVLYINMYDPGTLKCPVGFTIRK